MATQQVLGNSSEASIDQVNIWMRSTPWYQNQMRAWGQDPGHPNLTESQSEQIKRMAQANGVVVDEGNVEVDDHGNFNPIGHKLRNTLIVAGLAAATIATMGAAGAFAGGASAAGAGAGAAGGVEAGAAAGLGAAASSGAALGGMATLPALGTAGAVAGGAGAAAAGAGAFDAAGNFIGPSTVSSLGGGGAAAAGAGMSYGDLLKYGLPVAGNLVGGLIQAKATSNASDAQQKYLEEALAYEKESDAYKRQIDANAVTKEASRYADYSGRIAPFVANGTSSNDRMAALLGLPARSGSSGYAGATGGGSGYNTAAGAESADPISYADRLSPADKLKVDALLKASNSNDNPAYWYGVNAQHGGFDATGADWNKTRISTGDGVGKGYQGAPTATPAPNAPPAVTAQPQQRSASVQMRAPDGSVQTVNASDVPHYQQLGATVLQGAA